MIPQPVLFRATPVLLLCLAACGCGQTGPLYLPDRDVQTPVEIRTGAPPAEPAQTPAPDKKEDATDPGPGEP